MLDIQYSHLYSRISIIECQIQHSTLESESNYIFESQIAKDKITPKFIFFCQIFDIRYMYLKNWMLDWVWYSVLNIQKIWMLDWVWYSKFKSSACFRYKTYKIYSFFWTPPPPKSIEIQNFEPPPPLNGLCSLYVGSGPSSTVHPLKNIRNFKHPKKYSSYPPKIFVFLKTKKKYIEIQNFEPPKNGPSLRMYENIRVPPPPWNGDAH